jgi:hypothetical protein
MLIGFILLRHRGRRSGPAHTCRVLHAPGLAGDDGLPDLLWMYATAMPDPVPALWIRFRRWPVSDGLPSQNAPAAILESWRRIANRSGLIESHAESKFFTPNDVARQMQSIVQHNQCEFRRDADLVGHL